MKERDIVFIKKDTDLYRNTPELQDKRLLIIREAIPLVRTSKRFFLAEPYEDDSDYGLWIYDESDLSSQNI